MASSNPESQLRLHIRVLYVLIVSLVVVLVAGTWITQNQLRHLQNNQQTRGTVSKREVIEFRLVEDEDTDDIKIEPISPAKRVVPKRNHSQVVGFYRSQLKKGKVVGKNDTITKSDDKVSSRRKRQVDLGGDGGGSVRDEDDFDLTKYVWLTSYSRIDEHTE